MDWKSLVTEHGRALLLYARQWTWSLSDAEEVVQEGFVKYWKSDRSSGSDPVACLYTAVRQCAIDRIRSEKRRKEREKRAGEQLYDGATLFESDLEKDERRQAIENAMRKLPTEQSEVLVMKIWGELTFRQIGETLGISLNTAASRYRYALAALRGHLSEEVA